MEIKKDGFSENLTEDKYTKDESEHVLSPEEQNLLQIIENIQDAKQYEYDDEYEDDYDPNIIKMAWKQWEQIALKDDSIFEVLKSLYPKTNNPYVKYFIVQQLGHYQYITFTKETQDFLANIALNEKDEVLFKEAFDNCEFDTPLWRKAIEEKIKEEIAKGDGWHTRSSSIINVLQAAVHIKLRTPLLPLYINYFESKSWVISFSACKEAGQLAAQLIAETAYSENSNDATNFIADFLLSSSDYYEIELILTGLAKARQKELNTFRRDEYAGEEEKTKYKQGDYSEEFIKFMETDKKFYESCFAFLKRVLKNHMDNKTTLPIINTINLFCKIYENDKQALALSNVELEKRIEDYLHQLIAQIDPNNIPKTPDYTRRP